MVDEEVKRFLAVIAGSGSGDGSGGGYGSGSGSGSGDGSGGGYGSGSGYGSGYGYGYGDGYGDGSGSGSGYGSGHGSGYGYGYGYGYGDGDGDGSGSGSGSGDGDGIKAFNGQPVYMVDDTPTLIDQVRGSYAKGAILRDDLTLQPCFIARVGDCFAHGETLHEAQRAAEEKALEDTPLEERLDKFVEAFPDPDKAVPFADLYKWHHILTGSCKMGRDEFVKARSLDTSKDYTPRYFMTITATSYGSAQIKALAERYGITVNE